jgi:signal transduction histidine kinase
MHLATPILTDGQMVGAVYLSQSLRDVGQVMGDLRLRWLLATLVALLFSGVVGLVLSGAISRPLRRLTAAAGAVAQGRLDQQVPVRSQDELGRLSEAFNEMTARLRAARQMQIDFVANVSHELRTPLTAVKGLVETLRDGAVDDPLVRDRFLETVEDETDRLIRLVNDLLILSRADSQALNLQFEPVDLAQLAHVLAERMAPQAEARDLVIRVETSPCAPEAKADPDRVEQVLVNLLDNAIKYSRTGGTVVIRVGGGPEHMAVVQVRDEGMGIPAEDLPRVGERFYRADKARSRAEGGSGLGLAIAQALVKAQGGQLDLESVEGRGTIVTFTLPVD